MAGILFNLDKTHKGHFTETDICKNVITKSQCRKFGRVSIKENIFTHFGITERSHKSDSACLDNLPIQQDGSFQLSGGS